jgi:hypothetical protein
LAAASTALRREAAWRTLLDDLINRGLFSKSLPSYNGLNLVFVRRERAPMEGRGGMASATRQHFWIDRN